jgi:hypothetical protein
MDILMTLRDVVLEHGMTLGHKDIPRFLRELGMPVPTNLEGSKREKLNESLSLVPEENFFSVAQRLLDHHPINAVKRNKLQDLLWLNSSLSIPKRFRREIAHAIGDDLYTDVRGFDKLLEDLWILDDTNELIDFLSGSSNSLRDEIYRHIHLNPGDWSAEMLFDKLGAYEATDRRFCLFIEGLVSDKVRPDEEEQRRLVAVFNPILRDCGVRLLESGESGGYPTFEIVSLSLAGSEKPKNIIFASSEKPDLRLKDAISNRVEVLTHADKVLVYDRQISSSGLSWRELQNWWKETNSSSGDEDAKKKLYNRLRMCLPNSSPPQKNFFEAYYEYFKTEVPSLPALLPEVWLYWDHKTIHERGVEALPNLRMDFLMLLPGFVRVVIEIDGQQHYANERGDADPRKYAKLTSADRDMRLLGYDIYRFGGAELKDRIASVQLVGCFFDSLFKKYQVPRLTKPIP